MLESCDCWFTHTGEGQKRWTIESISAVQSFACREQPSVADHHAGSAKSSHGGADADGCQGRDYVNLCGEMLRL